MKNALKQPRHRKMIYDGYGRQLGVRNIYLQLDEKKPWPRYFVTINNRKWQVFFIDGKWKTAERHSIIYNTKG
jgi:hypothetical protein